MKYTKESVFISYVLRHSAIKLGIPITNSGYITLLDLISTANNHGYTLTDDIISVIVKSDNKGRYSYSSDGLSLRANQGHSMKIDVGLKKMIPPTVLYHGTSERYVSAIKKSGISKMKRTHVHMSTNIETATSVGGRHGIPVIITIDCKAMVASGIPFFISENGVWLTDHIDPKYCLFHINQ